MSVIYSKTETFKKDIEKGLVLVDFYADWCGPCQIVGPTIDKLAEEKDLATFVKVNVDDAQDIAGEYGVMSIPTLIAFKDGEKVDQKVGVVSAEDITSWLEGLK